jgi:uncharacterized membrane protein
MKPKLHVADLLVLLLAGLPFLYLAYLYPHLPVSVPTHFNITGKADAFGDKSSLWLILAITGGVSILVYLLIRFLPKIDPKKGARYSGNVNNKIGVLVILLLSTINFLIIHAAEKGAFDLGGVFPVVMGLFFAVMGNFMYNIKPNYFIGIRTPWTLENEETWRRTHQLAGKIWFVGGLVIAAVSLVLPARISPYFLIAAILLLAFIPIVYSYVFFKSLQKKINH